MTIEPTFLLEITLPLLCVAGGVGFCLLQQKNNYLNLSAQRDANYILEADRLALKDEELLERAQKLAEQYRELRNKLNKMQNKPIDNTPMEIDSEDLEEQIRKLFIAIDDLQQDIAEQEREDKLKSSKGNFQARPNAFFLEARPSSESDVNKASLPGANTFSFCGKE